MPNDATARLQKLLAAWEDQQTGYLPRREERFAVIADTLGELVGEDFLVLDVGCGPGSLAQRVLDAYPAARCVAVDADPVLLRLGSHVLTGYGDRLRWVDADLRQPEWAVDLGVGRVDAVLSTTALHWLDPGTLFPLYRDLAALVRPGGIFVNGDNMPFDPWQPTFARLADQAMDRATAAAFGGSEVPDWQRWWADAAELPELADAFAEREVRQAAAAARYRERRGDRLNSLSTHTDALSEAGFREVGTVWQVHDDRVLVAIR